jgi:hypothetical protein
VQADYWIRPTLGINALVQYEKWDFPLLAAEPQSNVTASVQITYWPKNRPH